MVAYYEPAMSISARLRPKMQIALVRYCKTHGLTKTEALERGLDLLLASETEGKRHPTFDAYERLRPRLTARADPKRRLDSVAPVKRHLDEKYPD